MKTICKKCGKEIKAKEKGYYPIIIAEPNESKDYLGHRYLSKNVEVIG